MPSFDIVSKTNLAEIDNAINGALKEISNRYDFKESKSEIKRENDLIEMISDDNYKIDQVQQILRTYCVRRKVDTGFLEFQKIENAAGGLVKQKVNIKQGISHDISKNINKDIKSSKLKVQVEIRGEEMRVSGKKRDMLQECIELIKSSNYSIPLQFINFRD